MFMTLYAAVLSIVGIYIGVETEIPAITFLALSMGIVAVGATESDRIARHNRRMR